MNRILLLFLIITISFSGSNFATNAHPLNSSVSETEEPSSFWTSRLIALALYGSWIIPLGLVTFCRSQGHPLPPPAAAVALPILPGGVALGFASVGTTTPAA